MILLLFLYVFFGLPLYACYMFVRWVLSLFGKDIPNLRDASRRDTMRHL